MKMFLYPEESKGSPCQIIVVDAAFFVDPMLGLNDFLVLFCVMLEFLAERRLAFVSVEVL